MAKVRADLKARQGRHLAAFLRQPIWWVLEFRGLDDQDPCAIDLNAVKPYKPYKPYKFLTL